MNAWNPFPSNPSVARGRSRNKNEPRGQIYGLGRNKRRRGSKNVDGECARTGLQADEARRGDPIDIE